MAGTLKVNVITNFNGDGPPEIPLQDVAGNYSATTVEGAFAEVATDITQAQTSARTYTAAATGGVARDYAAKLNEYFTAADVGKTGGDSVQNLVGITPTGPAGPRAYRATGYYTGTNFGGGTFVWAPSQPKNTHNGGWIISPTVPWDGSPSTHAAFLLGTGETAPGTNGCWVKIYENLTLECYGALGNWNGTSGNDDTQEIQRAVDTAPEYEVLHGRPGAWYYYRSILQTRRLKVDFKGARIRCAPDPRTWSPVPDPLPAIQPAWRVRPGFGLASPELRYNITGGNAGTNFITMATPSQASNFTPGEFVFVRSLEFVPGWDQSIGGAISRGSNGISEATRVISADTGTGVVTFSKPLEKTYKTIPAFTGVTYTRAANDLVTAVFPSAHNFSVNQGFTINTPTGGIVAGNYAVASVVDATTITFWTTFAGQTGGVASGTFNTTAVTPQIWKWRSQMDGCGIYNVREIKESDPGDVAPTSTFPHLFHFWGCIRPEIINVHADGFQMHVWNFESCEMPFATQTSAKNGFRPSSGGHAYLGQFTGGTYRGLADFNKSEIGVRHTIDFTGCYDCVSQNNTALDPVRAAFYAHGLGSKRCKSINDFVSFTEASNQSAGGWSVGNPAFAGDDDFEIHNFRFNGQMNFGSGQGVINFGMRSRNLKLVNGKAFAGRNALAFAVPAPLIRMSSGANGLELHGGDYLALYSVASNDAILDVRPAYSTDPADAALPSPRPFNVKVFGGNYEVGSGVTAFNIDADGEIVIRPDEIVGSGTAVALDLKSTCVPTVFEYETLLTGAFANDIIRGPTPVANMIWYENIRRRSTTTITTVASTGLGAVDLLRTRNSSTQGARGNYSGVLWGQNGTASGTNSVAGGGTPQATGSGAIAFGNDVLGNGPNSAALLTRSSTKNRQGIIAFSASTASGSTGFVQTNLGNLHVDTSDATPTRLITGALTGAATAANQFVIPSNTILNFTGVITARSTTGNEAKGWKFDAMLRSNGSTVTLIGATVTPTFNTAGGTWADPVITADNTLKSLAITVTGAAATGIRWHAGFLVSESSS